MGRRLARVYRSTRSTPGSPMDLRGDIPWMCMGERGGGEGDPPLQFTLLSGDLLIDRPRGSWDAVIEMRRVRERSAGCGRGAGVAPVASIGGWGPHIRYTPVVAAQPVGPSNRDPAVTRGLSACLSAMRSWLSGAFC